MIKTQKSIHNVYKQWKKNANRETPTQVLTTKESSRLQWLDLDAAKFNLTAYRQVIQKQSLI